MNLQPRRFACWLVGIAAAACFAAGDARAQTWAERLGYPPGVPVVLPELAGPGVTYEAEAAVAGLLDDGLTASVSASAPGPWFPRFAAWRRGRPDACVGLALTLNCESTGHRFRPLTGPDTSLVDPQGYFWRTIVQTTINASPEDVERELVAQLRLAQESGLRVSHFTTHLGVLFARADLTEVYLRLSQRHWIPAPVVELTPDVLSDLAAAGFPVEGELVDLVARYPLPKLDDFAVLPATESYEQKRRLLVEILDALPGGLTQITFRPATEGASLAAAGGDARQGVWDDRLLRDELVHQVLEDRGAILTTWTEVMDRFEGTRPSLQEAADAAGEPIIE